MFAFVLVVLPVAGQGASRVQAATEVHPKDTGSTRPKGTESTKGKVNAGRPQSGAAAVTPRPAAPPAPTRPDLPDQPFDLPGLSTSADDASGDAQKTAWLTGVAVFFVLTALTFQALAAAKLRGAERAEAPALGQIQNAVGALRSQAWRAAGLYATAVAEMSRPAPPPVAAARTDPPFFPPQPLPPAPARVPEPPREPPRGSDLVADYLRVRATADRDREIEWFESTYRYKRISCVNYDDWRHNPNFALSFEESPRGLLLMVKQGPQILAFPWFAKDLQQERRFLDGIFEYPPGDGGALRVAQPATLSTRGTALVLSKAGVLDANG